MAQALLWVVESWEGPGPSLWEFLQPWPLHSQHCVPGGQAQGQELEKSLHQQTEHNVPEGEENAIYDLLAQSDYLPWAEGYPDSQTKPDVYTFSK